MPKPHHLNATVNGVDDEAITRRIVVITLGIIVFLTLLVALILAMFDKPIPEMVIIIGSTSIGALGGVLGATALQRRD